MSAALALAAVLSTTPVIRGRLALGPTPARSVRRASRLTLAGLGTVTVVVVPAFTVAADISAPTARIAAGLVIAVTSLPDLWRAPVVAGATDPSWRAGVVPVAFPELFAPPLAAALSAAAIDGGLGAGLGLTVVAVVAAASVDALPGPRSVSRTWRGAAGARAAAAVAVGLALTMNGVYDI